jgi:YD repeat-containing protein
LSDFPQPGNHRRGEFGEPPRSGIQAADLGHGTVDTQYAPCACSPLGKVSRVSQPYAPGQSPVRTVYTSDGSGRTLTVTAPDGISATRYSYQGNQTTVTDPAGNSKTFMTDHQLAGLVRSRIVFRAEAGLAGDDLIRHPGFRLVELGFDLDNVRGLLMARLQIRDYLALSRQDLPLVSLDALDVLRDRPETLRKLGFDIDDPLAFLRDRLLSGGELGYCEQRHQEFGGSHVLSSLSFS